MILVFHGLHPGTRRGLIDNVASIGYINATTGAFVTDNIRESLRDNSYTNRVNPNSILSQWYT